MLDTLYDRHVPKEGEKRCEVGLAGYEAHAKHRCIFQLGHLGRHNCEHGKDGGWIQGGYK